MRFVPEWLRTTARLIRRSIQAFVDDDAPLVAAGLAFFALLSLAPLLMMVLLGAAPLLGEDTVRTQVVSQVERFSDVEVAETVDELLQNVERPRLDSLSAVLGIGVLLFGATRVFGHVQLALNRVWGVAVVTRGQLKRSIWKVARKRLLGAAMVAGLVVVLLASFVIGAALRVASTVVPDAEVARGLYRGLELLATLGLATVLFALVFRFLPDVRVRFRDVWLGAGVTALLFIAGRFIVSAYIGGQGTQSAFGAAGSLILLLVWIYYCCATFLLGAELTEAYAEAHGSGIQPESYAVRLRRTPASEGAGPSE
jgi:membrane protein